MPIDPRDFHLTSVSPDVLADFEQRLCRSCRSGDPVLDDAMQRILVADAKRLRPLLVYASAACFGASPSDALSACAIAVELLHVGSLIHDDIIDDASTRRGTRTIHAVEGLGRAIVAGDLMLAIAGGLAASAGVNACLSWNRAFAELSVGQNLEFVRQGSPRPTVDDVIACMRSKTGALLRASCELGARCAGAGEHDIAALADFGERFGVVFQMIDDLMDVLSSTVLWGKPVEHDLSVGVCHVPAVLALEDAGSGMAEALGGPGGPDVPRAYAIVRSTRYLRPTLALLDDWVAGAEATLRDSIQTSAARELAELPRRYADHVLATKVEPTHAALLASTRYAGRPGRELAPDGPAPSRAGSGTLGRG